MRASPQRAQVAAAVTDEVRLYREFSEGRSPILHLRRPLRPYQVRGALFAACRGRAILADERGLGKSAQAIAAALVLARRAGVRRVLVLCPAGQVPAWIDEIEAVADCPVGGPDEAIVEGEPSFRVAPIASAYRDRRTLAKSPPDLLILDEAYRVAQWDGRLGRAILALRVPHLLALTGTPIEADLAWIHPLAELVSPGLLDAEEAHLARHLRLDDRGSLAGYRHLDEARRRLSRIFLRRRAEEVASELPRVIESTVRVPGKARRPDTAAATAELHYLLRELVKANGHRVVVLARHADLVCAAAPVCERLRVGYACLWKPLPAADERELTRQFLLRPDLRVFLATDAAVPQAVLGGTRYRVCLDGPWGTRIQARRDGGNGLVQRIQMLARGSH